MDPIFNDPSFLEGVELEAKKAGGRDGRGQLPDDVWETYSSFANTNGGAIFLGVVENEDGTLKAIGIEDTQKVLDQLWNGLNDKRKVSINLLTEDSITRYLAPGGHYVLRIQVPRATRQQVPIYINGNPLKGTYRREDSGDFLCSAAEVRRMLAE